MKWSQWGEEGMQRCGEASMTQIYGWLREFEQAARKAQLFKDSEHVVYGQTLYNDGKVVEVRLYDPNSSAVHMTDNTLEVIDKTVYPNRLWVIHKR